MLMSQCFSGSFANAIFRARRDDLCRQRRPCAAISPPPPIARRTAATRRTAAATASATRIDFFEALAALGRMPEAEQRVLVDRRLAGRAAHHVRTSSSHQLLDRAAQRQATSRTERRRRADRRGLARTRPSGSRRSACSTASARPSACSARARSPSSSCRRRSCPQVSDQLRTYAAALAGGARRPHAAELRALPRRPSRLEGAPDPQAARQARRRRPRGGSPPSCLGRAGAVHRRATAPRRTALDAARSSAPTRPRRPPTAWRCASASCCACAPSSPDRGPRLPAPTTARRPSAAPTPRLRRLRGSSIFVADRRSALRPPIPPPDALPALDDDRQRGPGGDAGVDGHPVQAARPTRERKHEQRAAGAVTVMTVYPGLARRARPDWRSATSSSALRAIRSRSRNQVREWTMRREIGEPAPLDVLRGPQVAAAHAQARSLSAQDARAARSAQARQRRAAARPEVRAQQCRARRRQAAPAVLLGDVVRPCKFSVPEVLAFAAASAMSR